MICLLQDTRKAERLFAGWEDTMICSCLQKVMGTVTVTDPEVPQSALAYVGCFGFFAGTPDRELLGGVPEGYSILIPRNEAWAALIEERFPQAKRVTRYAIKKDTRFDRQRLRRFVSELPAGYELRKIDGPLYEQCLQEPLTRDFVSAFGSREAYLSLGRGFVLLKDGVIVSGASSFTRYREGIEIEVDTRGEERRKHLALAVCAALILECLKEGLYPSWDAQNVGSVHLAEKLGYELAYAYPAYEVNEAIG